MASYAHMHADSLGGRQVVLSAALELQIVVRSSNVAVEPGSSAGAASALSCRTFSSAPVGPSFPLEVSGVCAVIADGFCSCFK